MPGSPCHPAGTPRPTTHTSGAFRTRSLCRRRAGCPREPPGLVAGTTPAGRSCPRSSRRSSSTRSLPRRPSRSRLSLGSRTASALRSGNSEGPAGAVPSASRTSGRRRRTTSRMTLPRRLRGCTTLSTCLTRSPTRSLERVSTSTLPTPACPPRSSPTPLRIFPPTPKTLCWATSTCSSAVGPAEVLYTSSLFPFAPLWEHCWGTAALAMELLRSHWPEEHSSPSTCLQREKNASENEPCGCFGFS
mmetsp:Transcript_35643/g.84470  ORF Transcript_35643/g.84470 Transcript_35643/m.84470 type:complete len:246 (+) Transcript_35643:2229-2966(+)